MHHLRIVALVAVLTAAAVPAVAAAPNVPPPYQTSNGPQAPIGTFLVDANGNIISSFGGSSGSTAATTTPTALTPTTIATAGTYQQAAAAGKATTNGGFLQAPATNTGSVCVDTSASASAGRTTPTGGQICAAPGSTVTFPATSGAVYVYDATAGDTFSGSVS